MGSNRADLAVADDDGRRADFARRMFVALKSARQMRWDDMSDAFVASVCAGVAMEMYEEATPETNAKDVLAALDRLDTWIEWDGGDLADRLRKRIASLANRVSPKPLIRETRGCFPMQPEARGLEILDGPSPLTEAERARCAAIVKSVAEIEYDDTPWSEFDQEHNPMIPARDVVRWIESGEPPTAAGEGNDG